MIGAVDVFAVLAGGALALLLLEPAILIEADRGLAALNIQLLVAIALHFVLGHFGQYDSRDMSRFPADTRWLLLSLFLSHSAVLAVTFSIGAIETLPRLWYTIWLVLSAALLVAGRQLLRRLLASKSRTGAFDWNVAVFGGGRVADLVADHLRKSTAGIYLYGVYDDRSAARLGKIATPVDGTLDDLIDAGRRGDIDQIIIALPAEADQRIRDIILKLEQLPVKIGVCSHIATDVIGSTSDRHQVASLGPIGLINVKVKPIADWGPVIKRAEDLLVSAVLLLLLAPVFAVIAIAVKFDSDGPVFFRQRRHGLNHRVIEILKFRSMRVMEDGAVIRQATRGDPRVTRVGRFLRSTSLDELPQLINIFKGDMSLVGPRPHALIHNEQFGEMLERYANRHQVKPGLTGWAQVNGARGETGTPEAMRRRVEYDLYYIDNWSVWFDLRILLATPVYGFTNANAY